MMLENSFRKQKEAMTQVCCCCIPTRTAVILYTVLVLVLSIGGLLAVATEDTRLWVGGYALGVHWLVPIIGGLGVLFSVGAFIGVNDNASVWVRYFAHFGLVRLAAIVVILINDRIVLASCESLSASGDVFTSIHRDRFNPALATVAFLNRCEFTRVWYMIWTIVDLAISAYGVHATYTWCHFVDNFPAYRITLAETKPLPYYSGFQNLEIPGTNAWEFGPQAGEYVVEPTRERKMGSWVQAPGGEILL